MTLVREPGSEILAQFTVPRRGTWLNTAINEVPLDAVYNSSNVFIREGKLRNRPGLLPLNPALPDDGTRQILGGMMAFTTGQALLLVVSMDRLYVLNGNTNTWSSVPVAAPPLITANNYEVVDMAFLETSATYVVLIARGGYNLKFWLPGDATVSNLLTNINATSVCISASRVIALEWPHTIRWSRVLDYTTWDALAVVKRAQTTDLGICVRSLSALSFILYKQYSIHVARAQAGLDEGSAFSFSEPIIVEGPAGIYAVVEVNGVHFYMTKSGRVAIFDGTSYPKWIADGVWFYLQSDMNRGLSHMIRGIYDYRLNTVIFFYPRVVDSADTFMTGMLIINLPFPGFEEQQGLLPYCFLAQSMKQITHVCTRRFLNEIQRAVAFIVPEAVGVAQMQNLSETTSNDAGINFTCSFQTGLQAAPDARHIQVTTESFLERATGYGTVSLIPVTSNTLETPSGTIHTADAQTISLETPVVNEYIGFNKKTRFFGFNYSWLSTSSVRYSGTVVYDSVKRRK